MNIPGFLSKFLITATGPREVVRGPVVDENKAEDMWIFTERGWETIFDLLEKSIAV